MAARVITITETLHDNHISLVEAEEWLLMFDHELAENCTMPEERWREIEAILIRTCISSGELYQFLES